MPVTVLGADGQVTRPTIASGDPVDAFVEELTHVVGCVESGKESPVLNAQLACDALKLCARQTESVQKRRLVEV
jgi:hypothetical protein